MRKDVNKAFRLMPDHIRKLNGMSTLLGVSPGEVVRQLIDNAQIASVAKLQASATLGALPAQKTSGATDARGK